MEAVALYTFRATEGDELSFNKGDMLKVRSDFESFSGERDERLWLKRHLLPNWHFNCETSSRS